ncbi:hypothetical protein [Aurantiacibacter spongiae]|uniref:Glycosyl transferase n=1 Tax=Aurantiacibacter spongiae TaxID=2488860 RepID=A0A3N5CMP0_9SPHN|nr:hypothetical protein [Aurantiacibacter spongiae]RPF70203.1 hypothetical protein EG799_00090 [Aurantiacibacter spongiae]
MARALFLFNHDAQHQIAHLADVAGATARLYPQIETLIACGTPEARAAVERHLGAASARLRWEMLDLPGWARLIAAPLDRIMPASRVLRLRAHADLFESVAIVVSTERTCLKVKKHLSPRHTPLFAKIPHGAGDRSVAAHPDYRRFDLSLVAGPKVVDQLTEIGVPKERIKVIGYPKFDGIDLSARPRLFDNDRPTVVYNPHFDPHLSSWYACGPDLLRWFASDAGQRFNCVFAPHVMLFRKELHVSPEYREAKRRPGIPAEARAASNILIDTDSPALFDMTYTLGADAYVGDVSSQVYEFLARPRPCFFLDCRDAPKPGDEGRHLFWETGPVARSVDELVAALPRMKDVGARYRARQEELFAYTIDLADRPSAERAADVIAEAVSS